MRSPLLITALCAAAFAACTSQPLSNGQAGTGGAGGMAGAGTAGAGGADLEELCISLAEQYRTAVSEAQSCGVGASGSCSQPVPSSLSVCDSCPVNVNDASKADAVRLAYDQAGCGMVGAPPPCASAPCRSGRNNVCVSIDGGSQGYCGYAPDDAGSAGTGGAGSSEDGGTMQHLWLANEQDDVPPSFLACVAGPYVIPAGASIFFDVADTLGDDMDVSIVRDGDGCDASTGYALVSAPDWTGSVTSTTGPLPAGSYNLAINCYNPTDACTPYLAAFGYQD